ncbi:MAG: YraN family protein [Bacteroidales bacterium]|nr:YraN family protein [Bacteroidales bacterium]
MAQVKFRFATQKERSADSRRKSLELGKTGEEEAARYLEEQGCVIIERNYRRKHREVDIIALDHGELAVVEVKTRSANTLLTPEEAVDHQKRLNIIKAANNYVLDHQRTEPIRFDIIAVTPNGNGTDIRHIKNAFNALIF